MIFTVEDNGIGIAKEEQERILNGFTGWIKAIPARPEAPGWDLPL